MAYSLWQMVDMFIQTGELTDALDLLNQQLIENPHDTKARGTRAEIYLRLNMLEHAITDFRALPHPTPDQSIHHAVALKRLGILGLALDALTDAFSEWDGEKTGDYHRLVDCFVDIAITRGDVEDLQRALDHLSKVQGVYVAVRQGEICQLLGDFHASIAYYSQAIDGLSAPVLQGDYLAPTLSSWLCARAGCYQAVGDDKLAIADYALASALVPDDRSIQMKQALLLNDHDLMRQIWTGATAKQRALLEPITPQSIREDEA